MLEGKHKIPWPNWETIRLIGRGSFGAVYEIQRDLYGKTEQAAMKVISIPENNEEIDELYSEGYDAESVTTHFKNHLESIIREYTVMLDLKGNTNVVYCDDLQCVQHDDGIGWDIFIKMELLTPLTKAMGKEIRENQVIRLGKDMCSALVLCKNHNIVHRDIKPQNIFVSKEGHYKLGDFGIARTMEHTTGATERIGTYEYMAPEVYRGQPYGASADIYSLGLVLYWMLNDKRGPFLPQNSGIPTAGEKESAFHRRFEGEVLPSPIHGSDELQRIVLKACAYDPKDRYASAAEMLEDLNHLTTTGSQVAVAVAAAAEPAEVVCTDAQEDEQEERTVGLFGVRQDESADIAPEDKTVGLWGTQTAENAVVETDEQTVDETTEGTVGVFDQITNQKDTPAVLKPQGEDPEEENLIINSAAADFKETDRVDSLTEGKPSKRCIPVWLWVAIPVVLLVAGLCLLFACGRNMDSQEFILEVKNVERPIDTEIQYSCENNLLIFSVPGETSFSNAQIDVVLQKGDGVAIPFSSSGFDVSRDHEKEEFQIKPTNSLGEGVYRIYFLWPNQDGDLMHVGVWLCYGCPGKAYQLFAGKFMWREETIVKSWTSGKYLNMDAEGRLEVTANGGFEFSSDSHLSRILSEKSNVLDAEFVARRYTICGSGISEGFVMLEYDGWYFAANKSGTVYLTRDLNEDCYWVLEDPATVQDSTSEIPGNTQPVRFESSYWYSFNFAPSFGEEFEPENWTKAVNNENFRKAVVKSINRLQTLSVYSNDNPALSSYDNPEKTKNNTVTPAGFITTDKDYVLYGDLAKYTNGDNFNEAAAKDYAAKARMELEAAGATFPVKMLLPYDSSDPGLESEVQVMEQRIESVLGSDFIDVIIMSVPESAIAENVRQTGQYAFMKCSWGTDRADPEAWTEPFNESSDYGSIYKSNDVGTKTLYSEYQRLINIAKNTTSDLDARYEAFANAEAFLLEHAFVIPMHIGIP